MRTIGEGCGYQHTNSFWFAFKQATGMSPEQYRKKNTIFTVPKGKPGGLKNADTTVLAAAKL